MDLEHASARQAFISMALPALVALPAPQAAIVKPMEPANVKVASTTMVDIALAAPMVPFGVIKLKLASTFVDKTLSMTPLSDLAFALLALVSITANAQSAPTTISLPTDIV